MVCVKEWASCACCADSHDRAVVKVIDKNVDAATPELIRHATLADDIRHRHASFDGAKVREVTGSVGSLTGHRSHGFVLAVGFRHITGQPAKRAPRSCFDHLPG